MVNVYARSAKISNASGRSDYISNEKRQEEIILHKENMMFSWKEHSSYEKSHQKSESANNEALEVHIALPNELSKDKEMLEQVCDELVYNIVGINKDYEYAVHWNHNRTNLHVHILFSERENKLEVEPKVYKRDIYYNFDEKKIASKSDPNAQIIHFKGEVQTDKDGNIKYNTDIFKAKDKTFTKREWIHDKNRMVESVMKSHGFDLEYRDRENPYLSQKKLYKNGSKDYLDKAKEWNEAVKRYNEGVKEHILIEPEQLFNYVEIKREVLANVKEANADTKKITSKAIEFVQEMSDWVADTLRTIKVYLNRKVREYSTMSEWNTVKDKFGELFEKSKAIDSNIFILNRQIDTIDEAYEELDEIIDSKLDLIKTMEQFIPNQELLNRLAKLEKDAYKKYTQEEYEKKIEGLSLEERIKQAKYIIYNNNTRSKGYGRSR